MIKIFTISSLLNSENRRRVFPLLFDIVFLKDQQILEKYSIVNDIKYADVAIFPIDLLHLFNQNLDADFWAFVNNAKMYNIPIWVYTAGDFGKTFSEDLIVFRLSGFKSKLTDNSEIMPCFVSDPYQNILEGNWQYVTKTELPKIGFVGQANGSGSKLFKEYLIYLKQSFFRIIRKDHSDWQQFFPASLARFKILDKLEKNPLVKTDFILRSSYRAGAKNEDELKTTTEDFYKNIEGNLYTLCIRGAGNFSVRFYETLIMGRIPVLIDTDVQLPLQDSIRWENHIIFASMNNVAEKLIEFHKSRTEEELVEIQQSNRKLVMEKLNRLDYFIEISKAVLK